MSNQEKNSGVTIGESMKVAALCVTVVRMSSWVPLTDGLRTTNKDLYFCGT